MSIKGFARRAALALAVTAALGLPAAAAAPRPAKATRVAPRDWTRQVADTPLGWQVGNPAAAHRLVEYGSLNCGHCAALSMTHGAAIMAMVRSGRLAFEFRPMTLFAADSPATALARCVAPARRFAFIEALYRANRALHAATDRVEADAALVARLNAAAETDPAAFLSGLAQGVGLDAIAAAHGLGAAAQARCMAAPDALTFSDALTEQAHAAGVHGTPTLYLDGAPYELADIAALTATVAR